MTEPNDRLAAILAEREARWQARMRHAPVWPSLLSATLRAPMPCRAEERFVSWFFETGRQIIHTLAETGFGPTVLEETMGADGPLLMAGCLCTPHDLKLLCIAWEEEHKGGRLLDLDVTTPLAKAVSRRDLGLPPRRCFLCGRPAAECASRGLHTRGEVVAFARSCLDENGYE